MFKTEPKHVYEIYIRTTQDKLWEAITNPEFTRQYFYGSAVESTWEVGATVSHNAASGKPMIEGTVLEVDPPRRLVTTFANRWGDAESGAGIHDRPSRITWTIEASGETCKLTLVHDDFDGETETYKSVGSGWNPVLSGLKTLLETGQALVIAS